MYRWNFALGLKLNGVNLLAIYKFCNFYATYLFRCKISLQRGLTHLVVYGLALPGKIDIEFQG